MEQIQERVKSKTDHLTEVSVDLKRKVSVNRLMKARITIKNEPAHREFYSILPHTGQQGRLSKRHATFERISNHDIKRTCTVCPVRPICLCHAAGRGRGRDTTQIACPEPLLLRREAARSDSVTSSSLYNQEPAKREASHCVCVCVCVCVRISFFLQAKIVLWRFMGDELC